MISLISGMYPAALTEKTEINARWWLERPVWTTITRISYMRFVSTVTGEAGFKGYLNSRMVDLSLRRAVCTSQFWVQAGNV